MAEKVCDSCKQEFHNQDDFLKFSNRWRVCDTGHLWFNCNCGSTLLIKKGKHDWYSPGMGMSEGGKSIFNQLSMGDLLPNIPSAVMQIQQKLDDEHASSKILAQLTKGAPLIAASILKMANTMKPYRSKEITSLEHAISFVGVNTLKELVLSSSLQSFKFKSQLFDSQGFWQDSLLRGKISERLVDSFNRELPKDQVYLAATLCNIGKAVMAICFPEQTDKIEQDLRNPKVLGTWLEGERRMDTYDHRVLGEIGGAFWGLPDYVLQISLNHHDIPRVVDKPELLHMVALANQLTYWVTFRPNLVEDEILTSLQKSFKIDHDDLDSLAEECMPLKESA